MDEQTKPREVCPDCMGWGEIFYDDTFGFSQSTPCTNPNCTYEGETV